MCVDKPLSHCPRAAQLKAQAPSCRDPTNRCAPLDAWPCQLRSTAQERQQHIARRAKGQTGGFACQNLWRHTTPSTSQWRLNRSGRRNGAEHSRAHTPTLRNTVSAPCAGRHPSLTVPALQQHNAWSPAGMSVTAELRHTTDPGVSRAAAPAATRIARSTPSQAQQQ